MDNYLNFNDFLKVSTILQISLHRKLGSLNFKAHKILNKMSYQNMNICSHSRTHEAKINARKKIHMCTDLRQLCANIFMIFVFSFDFIVISLICKFHKDPIYRCGDICKMILTLKNYFCRRCS